MRTVRTLLGLMAASLALACFASAATANSSGEVGVGGFLGCPFAVDHVIPDDGTVDTLDSTNITVGTCDGGLTGSILGGIDVSLNDATGVGNAAPAGTWVEFEVRAMGAVVCKLRVTGNLPMAKVAPKVWVGQATINGVTPNPPAAGAQGTDDRGPGCPAQPYVAVIRIAV